jgi:hypothetical protein
LTMPPPKQKPIAATGARRAGAQLADRSRAARRSVKRTGGLPFALEIC